MSKAKRCEWCGGDIAANENRVRLPMMGASDSMTYHTRCYCRVYAARCLRDICTDDLHNSIGIALAKVVAAASTGGEPD